MLKLSDVIIDPKSLGSKSWLTEVSIVYSYKDNKRTDEIVGHKYVICLPDKNYEKIGIKIDGKKLLDAPETGVLEVKFDNLEIFAYSLNGTIQIGGRATAIQAVTNKA